MNVWIDTTAAPSLRVRVDCLFHERMPEDDMGERRSSYNYTALVISGAGYSPEGCTVVVSY